jgi:hypothetical protein
MGGRLSHHCASEHHPRECNYRSLSKLLETALRNAMYHFLENFAGPIATIIAATAAFIVTLLLGKGQLKIAKQQAVTANQQANTALNRLKLDLYDKRFNIYTAVLDLYQVDMSNEFQPTDYSLILDATKDAILKIEAAKRKFPKIKEKHSASHYFLFEKQDGIYDILNKIEDGQNVISAHEENNTKQLKEVEHTRVISEKAGKARLEFETILLELEIKLAKYLDFSKI